jgi:tetratricopeptide (TPR) repeat protein
MLDRPKATDTYPDSLRDGLQAKLIDLTAVLILIPVLLPLVVVFTRSLHFDTDPRTSTLQSISLGPTGSAWLAVASVAIAALALAVAVWAGGRIRWWSFVLVAAGIVPCLLKMGDHIDSRLHGGAWIAAATLGLAAVHLAQFPRAKRLIVTAMIAMALPLFIQGAWYVYVEHPATVESFMANERQSIEARGLVYDSAQHAKYLTRLTGNDVIGAVGMSNVLGSILAAITVLGLAAAAGAMRHKGGWLRQITLAVVLAILGWALVLTQSKGAVLALLAVLGFGACVLLLIKIAPRIQRVVPALCVLLVLAGSAAVGVRGAMGPPDGPDGERSMLFRFHYWQGASSVMQTDPSTIMLGVGPGHFKDRYEAVRNPISPEVVSSTHNVFVDFAVMLGVGGIAWGVLLLMWLWRAGVLMAGGPRYLPTSERAPPEHPPDHSPDTSTGKLSGKQLVRVFGLLAAVVFGTQYAVQFPGLYAETAILWLVGTLGFVALSAFVIYPVLSKSQAWLDTGVALAATLLLLHAQIEMTFFWDTATAFVWVVVGVSAAGRLDESLTQTGKRSRIQHLPAFCLALLAATLTFGFAEPMTQHQTHLAKAARLLKIAGPAAALDDLDQAAAVIGNDPTTTRWRIRLRQELASARIANGQPDIAARHLDAAWAVLDEAELAGLTGLSAVRRRGSVAQDAFYITGDRAWLRLAEAAFGLATDLSPHGLSDHVRLADARWQLGEFNSAKATYRRALDISEGYYLDPEIQLTEAERKRIESRLADEDSAS